MWFDKLTTNENPTPPFALSIVMSAYRTMQGQVTVLPYSITAD